MAASDAPHTGPRRTFWWVLLGIAIAVAIASVVLIVTPPSSTGTWGTLIATICTMITCVIQLRRRE